MFLHRGNKKGSSDPVLTQDNVSDDPLPIQVVSASFLGGRKYQQDVLDYRFYGSNCAAAAVCDGMGGLNGGTQAADTACSKFFQEYEALEHPLVPDDFVKISRRLDQYVTTLQDQDGLSLDGGSTIVAAVIQENQAYWLSVGDSKIGLYRGGQLAWISRSHNYQMELDEALLEGNLSDAEYQAELPRGRALLSYLGCGDLKYIDSRQLSLLPEDIIILCSDGFYELLPSENPENLFEQLDDHMGNLMELLLPQVNSSSKGMDNASVVLMRYKP